MLFYIFSRKPKKSKSSAAQSKSKNTTGNKVPRAAVRTPAKVRSRDKHGNHKPQRKSTYNYKVADVVKLHKDETQFGCYIRKSHSDPQSTYNSVLTELNGIVSQKSRRRVPAATITSLAQHRFLRFGRCHIYKLDDENYKEHGKNPKKKRGKI